MLFTGMILSGCVAFTPKFVEAQFSVNSSWAAVLVGEYMLGYFWIEIPQNDLISRPIIVCNVLSMFVCDRSF